MKSGCGWLSLNQDAEWGCNMCKHHVSYAPIFSILRGCILSFSLWLSFSHCWCSLSHQPFFANKGHAPLQDPTPWPSFRAEGSLAADMILQHHCVRPSMHPQFPRHLLTHGWTPTPSCSQTQRYGCSLHVVLMVLPVTKQTWQIAQVTFHLEGLWR